MPNFSQLNPEELQKLTTLEKKEGNIYVLTLHFKTFSPKAVHALHMRVDELEAIEGPMALITTCDHPKMYSAGLNFGVFAQQKMEIYGFLWLFNRLLSRWVKLSFPTIACINGHCYAAGYMLAIAHDFRVMREELGNICVSEINIGAVIPKGMIQLMKMKLRPDVVRDLIVFGTKFNGRESEKLGLVDKCLPMAQIMDHSMSLARAFVKKSTFRFHMG